MEGPGSTGLQAKNARAETEGGLAGGSHRGHV